MAHISEVAFPSGPTNVRYFSVHKFGAMIMQFPLEFRPKERDNQAQAQHGTIKMIKKPFYI